MTAVADKTALITPKSGKVGEVFAFVVRDGEGIEHVLGARADALTLPMITADFDRLDSLRSFAKEIARDTGFPIKLLRFSKREEVEAIVP